MTKFKENKWKIFIVGHNSIHPEMYARDKGFNFDNYEVINVSTNKIAAPIGFNVIKQDELNDFVPLGKWWAESEAIYNVWTNKLHDDLDYVGFIHYDKELKSKEKLFGLFTKNTCQITKKIKNYIKNQFKAHISFETHLSDNDYAQKILLDENKPNTLTGEGKNCYDAILDDYNNYFKTNYSLKDLFNKKFINLCSCFLIDTQTFEKMMQFMNYLVQSNRFDGFDTEYKYRIQGGMMERYFGVFLAFEYDSFLNLDIPHHYNKGLK
jgi:hypothetical protein